MTDAARNLDHYISNPQDLDPTDAATVARLMQEAGGTMPTDKPDPDAPKGDAAKADDAAKGAGDGKAADPPKEGDDKPGTDAKPDAKADDSKAEDGKGQAVLAPDGKSHIPYSVLKSEREGRAAAESATRDLAATVENLTAQLAALKAGKPADDADGNKTADEIEAEIEKIAAEAPALADSMRALIKAPLDAVRKLEEQVKSLSDDRAKEVTAEADAVNAEVQKAIDNNPNLVAWRTSEDTALWEEAKAVDTMLRSLPAWADKTFDQRFARVVELVAANHPGEDIVVKPAASEPSKEKPSAPAKPSQAEIEAAAARKLAATGAPKVATLTDMPAGAAPEQSESDKLENMSMLQLHAKFEGMTPRSRSTSSTSSSASPTWATRRSRARG
jgi:hypothetical protein